MSGIYQGFGLRFQSDLPLPGFAAASGPADVIIRLGERARAAAEASGAPSMKLRSAEEGFVFRVPETCDYWIRNAAEIHLSPAPGVPADHVALYLCGSAIGMILHMRGIQTLHAATVVIAGCAIAFVGDQGAGKSTLAATMAEGHQILGDDVIALEMTGGEVLAHPGGSEFKLWQETLAHLGRTGRAPIANREEKFFVETGAKAPSRPVRLGAVVVLERRGGAIGAERVPLLEATDLISGHGYRPEFVPILGRQAEHFRQSAALAAALPVWRLNRPDGLAHLAETQAWLEAHWPELTAATD
ncbi:MAG: hypothetical protein AAGE80_16495 [Pseudomonadota bacterium]